MPLRLPTFIPRPGDLILGRTGPAALFPKFRLRHPERATHMYVLGITGQGKSKLLEHCLCQDILAGHGCGVLDPHSDLARDLLGHLAQVGFFRDPHQRQRVIYFDPARRDYLVPFNVLASTQGHYVTAVNLLEAFRRTWPESLREAPRFSNILLASLLVLMANQLTLADLPRLLMDKPFRETLLGRVHDAELVSIFHQRLDKWGREERLTLEAILNKVSAFTLNPLLRFILGQPENGLDFRRMMDAGQVFIADLGRCDSETRRLLGSLIMTGVEQAAMSRIDAPSHARRPFFFYVDEFQDFCANEGSTTTLSQILSESRKFGLHLTLAHQTLGQLSSERLRAALGNVGTQITFAVDRVDAEIMARKLFRVSGEEIKHEVENELQQEKSHPVYYSLPEIWEQSIQQIQSLRPRTCLVKTPQNGVRQLYTLPMPKHTLSEAELERLKLDLLHHTARPYGDGNADGSPEQKAASHAPTFYEAVENSEEREIRRVRLRG